MRYRDWAWVLLVGPGLLTMIAMFLTYPDTLLVFLPSVTACVIALVFIWPDNPLSNYRDRRRCLRTGALDLPAMDWLVARFRAHPEAPTEAAFYDDLHNRIHASVQRRVRQYGESDDGPEQGLVIVDWYRHGESPVLLRNALAAGMSTAELRAHLDGTARLDPDTAATLAALQTAGSEKTPRHGLRPLAYSVRTSRRRA